MVIKNTFTPHIFWDQVGYRAQAKTKTKTKTKTETETETETETKTPKKLGPAIGLGPICYSFLPQTLLIYSQ